MGEGFLPNAIGLALGHLYIFLKDIYVIKSHKDLLATPRFLNNWWYRRSGAAPRNQPSRGDSAFSGSGVRIG
jgi:hypothetical protein